MKEIKFSKMHGTGNDFVVIDCINQDISNRGDLAKSMCTRRFGVGADQLILICNSDSADYTMEIYNPDGSNVEMCGNALRAVALYIRDELKDSKNPLKIDTLGGLVETNITGNQVTVNMGQPSFTPKSIGLSEDREFINTSVSFSDNIHRDITCVSMGNPHCVQFVRNTENCPLETEGPIIENHKLFKNKTNVEFVEILSRKEVNMRVWERGTGETLACGSGACAVAVACIQNNLTERTVLINLRGGQLKILWNEEDNCIYMTGPAAFVFKGIWSK
ncbi:MAG: diaminopimelate epimerase [Lentisphaeraceae bacterium]|nr:diaminopimelate epimerase [Lentisphaeraceae bacterium]